MPDPVIAGFGVLIVRIVVGLGIAAHGSQKLFGWFGGNGFEASVGFFESGLGYRPGKLFVLAACGTEIGAGALIFAGLGGPIGPALLLMMMIVGAAAVHFKNGFFAGNGGYELNVLYSAVAILLAFQGMGIHSLDAFWKLQDFYTPSIAWIAVAAAIVLAAINLAARRPPVPAENDGK